MLVTQGDVERKELEEDKFEDEGEKEILIDFAPADVSYSRDG